MSKYGNRKTVVDNITFDSQKEANRYADLKLLQKAGEISGLDLQPKFRIEVNGIKICDYIADFRYVENEKIKIEDVKGMRTPVYKLKKKLMLVCYGIEVLEI